MDMSSPTFEVSAKDYRINIPFQLPEEVIDEKIKLFYTDPGKVKSPIPGLALVNIRKVDTEYQGEKLVGIMFVCISLQKFMVDKGLKETDKFFVKLIDAEGNFADKCLLTSEKVPYFFYYDGDKHFNVIEKIE